MRATDQTTFLESLEAKLDKQLTLVIDIFQNQTDQQLANPPHTGGWSTAECLDHLVSYGRYYLPLLSKKLKAAPQQSGQRQFSSGWLGRYFINMMDPGQSTRRYKAAAKHLPVQQRPGHQTVAEFIGQLEELLGLVRYAGNAELDRIRIPVSVAPFLTINAGDTMHFLIVHNQRHIEQALRNR